MSLPYLLVVSGPTASGKTSLALELALRFDGEIVNADSRQIYRGMDIGTAKPSPGQRAAIPHHVLDVVSPDEDYSLALYQHDAYAAIDAIAARERLPILVGGTGLYLRAVSQGYTVPRVPPNQSLRQELESTAVEYGVESLVRRLRRTDPAAAERVDTRNARRVIRAIEIAETAGTSSAGMGGTRPRYETLQLLLTGDRALLYKRAETRLAAMIDAGFLDEIRRLLDTGYAPGLASMTALGYRELASYLLGASTLDGARAATLNRTRAFIKRQETWFRSDNQAVRLAITDHCLERSAMERIEQWFTSRK